MLNPLNLFSKLIKSPNQKELPVHPGYAIVTARDSWPKRKVQDKPSKTKSGDHGAL